MNTLTHFLSLGYPGGVIIIEKSFVFFVRAKMDEMNMRYFGEMYSNLEKTFDQINQTLSANREEIKDLAYKTQNDLGAE